MRPSILSATVASTALPTAALRVSCTRFSVTNPQSACTLARCLPLANAQTITYDTIYDQGERPLSEVACWNPTVPGLFPDCDDWLLQKNIPIGIVSIPSITGWEDPDCITCWMVTWEEGARTSMLLAIDGSKEGFVTSLRSMNLLTDGQAKDFNRLEPLEVRASRVSMRNCGFAPGDVPEEL
ncbi:hypothetical protein LZ31DRAFT_549140 [Colletotrichum somersetense]|nr:hypothetical protein LZ31DRAFT_549140 [Colletotrichum somersetense]